MTDIVPFIGSYLVNKWAVLPLYGVDPAGSCLCSARECSNAGKHPMTVHGVKDATSDVAIVRDWLELWINQRANLGIATGGGSGLIALDIDPRNGGAESLEALLRRYEPLPHTIEAATGGGGRHILFRHPGGVIPNSSGKLGPGIDVKADGGYIVAPPSRHASGNLYRWVEGHDPHEELSVLPRWLCDLMQAPREAPINVGDRSIPVGARNDTLTRLAGSLFARGGSVASVTRELIRENRERCAHPLDEEEVVRIAKSIAKREGRGEAEGRRPSICPVSAADLIMQELKEPTWAVHDVLASGLTLLAGKPKAGKSFLALQVGLAVAAGEPLFGRLEVGQGDVLYCALEDTPRRLQSRIRLVRGESPVPANLYLDHELRPVDEGGLEAISEWLDEHRSARLVIIDTLQYIRPRRRSGAAYDEDHAALRPLKKLADDRDIALLVLHHQRKATAHDPVDTVNGTAGLAGVADGVLILDRVREARNGVLHAFGRDISDRGILLGFDAGCWSMLGDAPSRLSARSESRYAVVEALAGAEAGLTAREIAEKTNRTLGSVKTMVSRMNAVGELIHEGERYYTVTGNSVTPDASTE